MGHNLRIILQALGSSGHQIKSLRAWHRSQLEQLDYVPVHLMGVPFGKAERSGNLQISLSRVALLSPVIHI